MGNPLGDLISKGEGGYNSYNRGTYRAENGRYKILSANQDIDFSQLSIEEIQRRQALPITDPDRVFAVGKYQIIPATMKEVVAGIGIDASENYTAEIQERMFADALIRRKRPDIYRYITGEPDATLYDAQRAASMEWASVEDPATPGHAFALYERQGNRMHTTAAQIGDALDTMRMDYKLSIETGMSPDEAWRSITTGQSSPAQWLGAPHALPTGNSVGEVQKNLNKLHIPDAQGRALTADGNAGPRAQQAIESFQHQHGMLVDGRVTPQLLAATQVAVSVTDAMLKTQQFGQQYGLLPNTPPGWDGVPHAPRFTERIAEATDFSGVRARVESATHLRSLGADSVAAQAAMAHELDRDTVVSLQRGLSRLGFTDSRGRPLADDGLHGPNTQAAVSAFQREQGLPATGIADPATLSAVNAHVIVSSLQQQREEREARYAFQQQAQAFDARQAEPRSHGHDPLGRDTSTAHAKQASQATFAELRDTYAPPSIGSQGAGVSSSGRSADDLDHTSVRQADYGPVALAASHTAATPPEPPHPRDPRDPQHPDHAFYRAIADKVPDAYAQAGLAVPGPQEQERSPPA